MFVTFVWTFSLISLFSFVLFLPLLSCHGHLHYEFQFSCVSSIILFVLYYLNLFFTLMRCSVKGVVVA